MERMWIGGVHLWIPTQRMKLVAANRMAGMIVSIMLFDGYYEEVHNIVIYCILNFLGGESGMGLWCMTVSVGEVLPVSAVGQPERN